MVESAGIVMEIVREIVHTKSHIIPLAISLTIPTLMKICFIVVLRVVDDLGSRNSVGNSVHYFLDYFRHAVIFRAECIHSDTMETIITNML